MTPRLAWVWQCPACGFLASTLPSGAGTGVDGLESLRRENYEVILGRLDVRLPLAGARLLEVGCARGWFMEAVRARAGRRAPGQHPGVAVVPGEQRFGFRRADVSAALFPNRPAC